MEWIGCGINRQALNVSHALFHFFSIFFFQFYISHKALLPAHFHDLFLMYILYTSLETQQPRKTYYALCLMFICIMCCQLYCCQYMAMAHFYDLNAYVWNVHLCIFHTLQCAYRCCYAQCSRMHLWQNFFLDFMLIFENFRLF